MKLSEYHEIIRLYLSLSKAYGWDTNQLDGIELDVFFDYLIVTKIINSDEEEADEGKSVMAIRDW